MCGGRVGSIQGTTDWVPAPWLEAAALELGGGLLLAGGLLTPLAAAPIVAQSVVIIGQVHWRNGFFNTTGGFEFPLLIGLGAVAVAIAGPIAIAVDRLIGVSVDVAPTVALVSAALVAGLVGLIVPRLTAPDPMAHQHGAPQPATGRRPVSSLRRSP